MNSAAIALNRFGLGARPDDALPADPQRWLLDQFARYQPQPPAWASHTDTDALLSDYQSRQRELRSLPEDQRAAARQQLRRGARNGYLDAVNARLASAIDTPAPFVERLVHFWSNHFAVSVEKPVVLDLAGAYEAEAIRPHVLGRFEDLLLAAVRHPAMLVYLDQAQSVGPASPAAQRAARRNPDKTRGLNENLAREIMELHTLGVRSGYTQQDVTEFARALTGWSLGNDAGSPAASAGFQYRPALHEPGPRRLLGRSYAAGGQEQALAILRDLAASPATALHVATKLARHFAADDPPPALVQRLAAAYQRSGGDLPAVYRALIDSPRTLGRASHEVQDTLGMGSLLHARTGPARVEGCAGRRPAQPARPAGVAPRLAGRLRRHRHQLGGARCAGAPRRAGAAARSPGRQQRRCARAGTPDCCPAMHWARARPEAIARSESGSGALALLLVSPDFLRR